MIGEHCSFASEVRMCCCFLAESSVFLCKSELLATTFSLFLFGSNEFQCFHGKKKGKNNNHKSPSCSHSLQCLQLQTPSETVFGDDFWGLQTFSEGIWSTRDSNPRKIRAEAAPGGAAHRRPGTGFSDRPFSIRSSYMYVYIYIYLSIGHYGHLSI